jgi:hypothetical protein
MRIFANHMLNTTLSCRLADKWGKPQIPIPGAESA